MLPKWFAVALLVFGTTEAAHADNCDFDKTIQGDDYHPGRDESLDVVKALFDAGGTLSQHDADHLLLYVAQGDDIALARLLIERAGANVNARDEDKATWNNWTMPISFASRSKPAGTDHSAGSANYGAQCSGRRPPIAGLSKLPGLFAAHA